MQLIIDEKKIMESIEKKVDSLLKEKIDSVFIDIGQLKEKVWELKIKIENNKEILNKIKEE